MPALRRADEVCGARQNNFRVLIIDPNSPLAGGGGPAITFVRPGLGRLFLIRSNDFMSQHRSLRAASTLGGKRNVLKRYERLEILRKAGEWKAGARITGLRKTKPPV